MTPIVFVSGVTSGFGQAIAETLLAHGWRVIGCGRRKERLNELMARHGERFHPLELDVRSRKAVFDAVAGLPSEWKEIGVLVNNAGLALGLEAAHEADLDDWDQMIDTNIKGLTYLTRAILPGMVERNEGYVINIGSIAGTYPYPGGNAYGATKSFVHQFSLNLRADLAGKAIRVTCIEPGLAETEFSTVRFHGDTSRAGTVYQGTEPLTGADIARTVHWCLTQPKHVNINYLEVMPVCQSFAGLSVSRK